MSNNNFKADRFKPIGVGDLYAEVILTDKSKVIFRVLGTFLSTLEVSSGKFIDFDKEIENALRPMQNEKIDGEDIALTYIDNVGFVNSAEYYPSNI